METTKYPTFIFVSGDSSDDCMNKVINYLPLGKFKEYTCIGDSDCSYFGEGYLQSYRRIDAVMDEDGRYEEEDYINI